MTDQLIVPWFIPTHGDGRYFGTGEGGRPLTLDYLAQVARAVDHLGQYGAVLPTGRSCEDIWMIASALAPMTKQMKFLAAIRPGLSSPENDRADGGDARPDQRWAAAEQRGRGRGPAIAGGKGERGSAAELRAGRRDRTAASGHRHAAPGRAPEAFLARHPRALSGGQRRVAIAR
jgi:hypothetical protein